MAQETDYEVEKIIKKDFKVGQFYYLVKWLGYSNDYNTWEPEEHLKCPEKVADFEKTRIGVVLEAKNKTGGMMYRMKFQDTGKEEEVRSKEANNFWPEYILKFFEQKLEWFEDTCGSSVLEPAEAESDTTGAPDKILYATRVSGELLVWAEWKNDKARFVPASEANKSWPALVIKYYEGRVDVGDQYVLPSNKRVTRREMARKRDAESVRVKISTRKSFDKVALLRKVGRRTQRSASVSIRSILKNTSNKSSFFARRTSTGNCVRFSETTQNERNATCAMSQTQDENGNKPNSADLIDFSGMDDVIPPTNAEQTQTTPLNFQLNQNDAMENFDPLKSAHNILEVKPSTSNAALLNEIDWSDLSVQTASNRNNTQGRAVPNLMKLNHATENIDIEPTTSHSSHLFHRYGRAAQNNFRRDFGLISYELFQRAINTLATSTSTADHLNYHAYAARNEHTIDLDMSDQHFGTFHYDTILDDRSEVASGGSEIEFDGPLQYESNSE